MLSINTLSYGQFDACFHADLSLHLRGAWNEESVCMNSMHTTSDNDIRALVHSNTRWDDNTNEFFREGITHFFKFGTTNSCGFSKSD